MTTQIKSLIALVYSLALMFYVCIVSPRTTSFDSLIDSEKCEKGCFGEFKTRSQREGVVFEMIREVPRSKINIASGNGIRLSKSYQ